MKIIIPTLLCLFLSSFTGAQTVTTELFKDGFTSPLDLHNVGDDRLFVVEQGGRIKILNLDGTVNATPFINISSLISSGGEQGLLGLAFHPDYTTNGYFYVNYTKTNGDTRISRFSVDPADPNLALLGSELTIIEYAQPFGNHNGGGIAFGPDNYLYISAGDGGSGGDPGNRAQNLGLLLGKLLRIDIDNPTGGNNYGIPTDNPFVSVTAARDEIWAYGLRNAWRFSFDSVTNDLWIGDVGQGNIEEIDRAASTAGGLNYGWRCYEGSDPFNTTGCPPMGDLTFPVAEYTHAGGNCSITGGIVYRGSVYSDILGHYFFADVCSGMIGTVNNANNLTNHGTFGGSWVGFGEDMNKELYILNHSGSIHKIKGGVLSVSDFSDPNLVVMTPNPASEVVTISIKNANINSIRILDLKGSVMFSEEKSSFSEKNIAVDNLSQGMYLVKITSEKGASFIKKLVIK